jgi:2-polyprenyl-3-methyl-5-hydroxy-6-metoxy-1,4-benzoquinol methylase
MNSETIDNCLICGSDSLKTLKNYEKDHLVRCRHCSFVFSRLRPTEDELNQTYAAYQRGSNAPTEITLEKLRARAKWLCGQTNVRTVLDVGCGDGHFLAMFSEMGCKTYGTEFDRESAKIAESKGAVMLEGSLTPALPESISGFDVIIFTEVIEHINNPRAVLDHFYKLLNPGGLVFITTPNFDGLERFMLGPGWGMIMYPEHITYFSTRTLDDVVRLSGLNKVKTYTENISLFRIVQFFNRFRKIGQVDAERVSAQAQSLVSQNKVAGLIKSGINGVLRVTNLGSSIVAVYKKQK